MTNADEPRNAVLVVEDEPLIRMDVIDMIEDEGFRTYGAGSAEEAIAAMEHHDDIGVLFTDVDMPGSMDGLKLAWYVRDRWPPVQIIIASGIVDTEKLDAPSGCLSFPKPYPNTKVAEALHKIAGQAS